ncbi:yap-binding protein [Botrytis cinerea]
MEVAKNPIVDIVRLAPPNGDPPMYMQLINKIFIEDQPSPELRVELLTLLEDLLQNKGLADLIGWDLVPTLIDIPGSESCLITIARLANPREVIISVLAELKRLDLDGIEDDWHGEEARVEDQNKPAASNDLDRFCFILSLLSIIHPRIKTKHPSRFLATTIHAIVQAFHPSHRAVMAIGKFAHIVSGKKRPTLPGRKSSLSIASVMRPEIESNLPPAPDPEAQEEDTYESAIQKKLLQGLVTHMLEMYIDVYPLEWAGRLQESFDPKRVVAGRTSLAEAFQTTPEYQTRETVAGQLVSLSRDLELANYDLLFDTIHSKEPIAHAPNPEDDLPDSPEDIPLSPVGCLFLLTSLIFSSVMFKSKTPEPIMSIFPDHAKLVARFFESAAGSSIAIVDAVVAIGLWLEHSNKFVSGEFKDNDYMAHLRALSLWSATNPSPGLRYCTHKLTSAILHAHPVDAMRLTFISKTLKGSSDEIGAIALKASAITWLKEELITAHERKTQTLFSTNSALLETQSQIFPNLSSLVNKPEEETSDELIETFSVHMAALNFLFFVVGEQYTNIIPSGMMKRVESEYLTPLKIAQESALKSLASTNDIGSPHMEFELLGEQISMCFSKLHEK